MTVRPYDWRAAAEANYRHQVARNAGAHRGVAFEITDRPVWSPNWLHIAVSGAVMWAIIIGVVVLAGRLVG